MKQLIIFTSLFWRLFNPELLLAQEMPPCQGTPYEWAQKLVGTWQEFVETDDGEQLIGSLDVSFELNGCVLKQKFFSPDSSFSFLSFGYVDPSTNMWNETFVLNNGKVASYHWTLKNNEIHLNRFTSDPENLQRLRIINLSDDYYEVMDEKSSDSGNTWKLLDLVKTRRVKTGE